jgi:hypothetical protein
MNTHLKTNKKSLSFLIITALLLSSLVVLINIPTVHATILESLTFESGTVNELFDIVNGNITIDDTIARTGSKSMKSTFTGDWENAYGDKYVDDPITEVYIEDWIYFSGIPANSETYNVASIVGDAAMSYEAIDFITIGTTSPSNYIKVNGTTYSYNFTINTWYKLNYFYKNGTGDGEIRLWLNDAEIITLTEQNYNGSFERYRCGMNSGYVNTPFNIWHDDIKISNSPLIDTPIVTITTPTNTTYSNPYIPVNFTATTDGTLDKKWFNIKNGDEWTYETNQTYTNRILTDALSNGTYTLFTFANTTLGNEANSNVTFTIGATEASSYTPAFNSDMLLQVNGNKTFLPNGTQVVLRGVNKPELTDDPDGIWMGETIWNEVNVRTEIENMSSRGVNVIRLHGSIYDWKLGINEEHSGISQELAVQKICNISAEYGMWTIYNSYRTGDYWNNENNTGQEGLPYPPYTNNTVINSEAEYVAFTQNVTAEMKDYGNFIFETWNEAEGGVASDWFAVVQDVISSARTVDFVQPIITQWQVSAWINLDFPTRIAGSNPMDWIESANLYDPNGNIIYSNHQYRNHIQHTVPTSFYAYSYDDILQGFTDMKVFENLNNNYCIFWGEIGANIWWDGEDWVKEAAFFNNSLAILNAYNISYCGWHWRDVGQYDLINADLTLTKGGDVFFSWLADWYKFELNYLDLDGESVSITSWEWYNSTELFTYTLGESTLTSGTYTLNTNYAGQLINTTTLSTATHGNTTVDITLQIKQSTLTTLAFNNTLTALTINEDSADTINFTATGDGAFQIVIPSGANASSVTKDGVAQDYGTVWTYDSANDCIIITSTLSTWVISFEAEPSPTPTPTASPASGPGAVSTSPTAEPSIPPLSIIPDDSSNPTTPTYPWWNGLKLPELPRININIPSVRGILLFAVIVCAIFIFFRYGGYSATIPGVGKIGGKPRGKSKSKSKGRKK